TARRAARAAERGGARARPGREGVRESPRNGARQKLHKWFGRDPVDFATGRMLLAQTDVALPGVLPLVFQRQFESSYRAGRWFGPTWSSTLDQRLETDAEGVVYHGEEGLLLAYPHPVPGGVPVLPEEGPRRTLERTPHGDYVLTDPESGRVHHFTGGGEREETALLAEVADRNGNRITFDYDEEGTPLGVVHSGGYRLRVETADGRVTALHLAGAAPDGGDQQLIRYAYDTHGNLTEVVNSTGTPLRFGYDDRGRITSWTDTNGSRFGYAYDDEDRCVWQSGEAGRLLSTLDYSQTDPRTGLRVTAVTDSLGHTTRYLVNDRLQIVTSVDATGATTRTERDHDDRVLATTDALGRTWSVERDGEGRPVAETAPDGSCTRVTYNELGLPTRVVGPDGAEWRYAYDERGNRIQVTDPAGGTTRCTYAPDGSLTSVTDALGATTRVRCDRAGLPLEITDPLGATTAYRRDGFGNPVTVVDPLGGTTRLAWTVEGRLTRREGPDGAQESWTYDGEGNCVRHVNPSGGETSYEYTHFDQLSARTGPDGVRYTFTHDTELRLTEVTNPQGLTWTYTYDPAGRLIAERDFDDRTHRYDLDPTGALTSRTTPLGEVIRYERDALGRTVRKDAAGAVTTYAYDPAGRLLEATAPGAEVRYQRDKLGRVKTELVNGRALTHAYDALGRRTRRTTPTGAVSTSTYDTAGNRTSLTANGHTLDFTHDAAGRETQRAIGANDLALTQLWDPAGRLTSQSLTRTASDPIQRRDYTYRADGYLTGVVDSVTGRTAFDLNAVGRVTAVHARDWTERYAYDEAGNQTEATWPETHAFQEAKGPRTYTGTTITSAGRIRYEHDAAGRVTLRQKTRLSRKPDSWRYQWDAEDRLVQATTPDGTVWRYAYDPLGRRTAKHRIVGGEAVETTLFAWDGPTLIEQTTTAPALPHPVTLTWDHKGFTPLTQTERLTNESTQQEIDSRFYAIVTDLVGTPTELVDESGDIAWRARSTLWGTTTWPTTSTTYTPLRFPGQYYDPETGLHYNYFRYYDPATARYASPDPLGLGPAPLPTAYVRNPHTWSDPFGLAPTGGCPPTPDVGDVDSLVRNIDERTVFHYSNREGYEGVLDSGTVRADGKGRAYVTQEMVSPEDAHNFLFAGNPAYIGKGDYMIAIRTPEGTVLRVGEQPNELIHQGSLRFSRDDIIYAGPNPFN
ncbi:DUF6531 domain-containing protein, partial [Streptomyces boncukensis]